MKIAINTCFGGYNLSNSAIAEYARLTGMDLEVDEYCDFNLLKDGKYYSANRIKRTDPVLIEVIERLGDEAAGNCSRLEIVEIPTGEKYRITDYDGNEGIELASEIHWDVAT